MPDVDEILDRLRKKEAFKVSEWAGGYDCPLVPLPVVEAAVREAAQPDAEKPTPRSELRRIAAVEGVCPICAARPVPAPDNPPVTFAFWECGHIEVDRGRSHACPLDVCGATYAAYAPVADEDVIRADERERLSARVYENGWCLRERSERARVFADADGEAPTREQKLVEILSRLTDPDPDGGTREQKLVEILSRLTDPDPCSYDHHGACRAHNLHKRPCPHGAAKDLLRELRPEGTDA